MRIGRLIAAGVIGGLVMEAYSLFAWFVLPYNRTFFEKIRVSPQLQQLFFEHSPDLHDGMWTFGKPGSDNPGGVILLYLGGLPAQHWNLLGGTLICVLPGRAVAWIYAATAGTWAAHPKKGLLFVLALGAIAALPAQFRLAVFVGHPIPFSLAMAADTIIEFFLLGLVLVVAYRKTPA